MNKFYKSLQKLLYFGITKIKIYLRNLRGTQRIYFVLVGVICLISASKFTASIHLLENPYGVYDLFNLKGYQRILYYYSLNHYEKKYSKQFEDAALKYGIREKGGHYGMQLVYNGARFDISGGEYGGPMFGFFRPDTVMALLKFMLDTPEIREELIKELESDPTGSKITRVGVLGFPTFNGITPNTFAVKSIEGSYVLPYLSTGGRSWVWSSDFLKDKYLSLSHNPSRRYVNKDNIPKGDDKYDLHFENLSKLRELRGRSSLDAGGMILPPSTAYIPAAEKIIDEKRALIGQIYWANLTHSSARWLADQYELLEAGDSYLRKKFSEHRAKVGGWDFIERYLEAMWEYLIFPILAIILLITFIPHYLTRVLAFVTERFIGWIKDGFSEKKT